MRLDDPQLRPGETEEQRRQRLIKAAKWTKLAKVSRAQANQSALAMRIIRLVFLVICGIVLTGAGIHSFNDPSQTGGTEGIGNQYLGPHGNAICMIAIGLFILGLSAYFLLRYIQRLRTQPNLNGPTT